MIVYQLIIQTMLALLPDNANDGECNNRPAEYKWNARRARCKFQNNAGIDYTHSIQTKYNALFGCLVDYSINQISPAPIYPDFLIIRIQACSLYISNSTYLKDKSRIPSISLFLIFLITQNTDTLKSLYGMLCRLIIQSHIPLYFMIPHLQLRLRILTQQRFVIMQSNDPKMLTVTFKVISLDNEQSFTAQVAENMNAFVAMLIAIPNGFTYKLFNKLGVMIETIQGLPKNQNEAYWALYYNHERSNVGIDSLSVTQTTNTFEWRLTPS